MRVSIQRSLDSTIIDSCISVYSRVGTDQDIVEDPKISGETNFIPEEVCQVDVPATKQIIPQDSLNDDIENPTQSVAVQPSQPVSVHLRNNMATVNPQIVGSSNAVEGIAVLARFGRLLKMQSLFDIEVSTLVPLNIHNTIVCAMVKLRFITLLQVLGPEEKVMVIVGESWDWNAPKRLISAVTEACVLHIRRECLLSKFNSTHLQSMSSLRTMRFLFNEFSSLRQVGSILSFIVSILKDTHPLFSTLSYRWNLYQQYTDRISIIYISKRIPSIKMLLQFYDHT
jgi:hypothetical protein